MRISAIIPTFNRRQRLTRALQSIDQQSSAVDEIIVVDDGSTDASHEMVAREFPAVKIIRQQNSGVSAARNRGIEAAQFEWIALLDSDDSWWPEKIAQVRAAWRRQPDCNLFHSEEVWVRRGRRVNPMKKHRKRSGWIFEACLPLCVISPSAAVIRRATLLSLGMFDESLPACEDYDLWLRLCHCFPVYLIEQPLITKYGGHDDQLSRQYPAMDRFRIRALHRLLEREQLQPAQYAAATHTLLAKLDILINGARKHQNQSIIDEFIPLRRKWSRVSEISRC